jgi:hypothetical protein
MEFPWVGDVAFYPQPLGEGCVFDTGYQTRADIPPCAGITRKYVVAIQSVGSVLCKLMAPFQLPRLHSF